MHYMNQANAHNATQDTTMQDSATHDTATKATQDTAPLKGITVIDWTQVQSGPSCTQMLAWMGADVIKVEKVQGGDPTRNEMNDVDGSYSLYFLQLNANKKSITLNMRDPEGKKILAELLKKADVFVENIGPGDVEKLGFGWNDIHAINPRLIMASLKGFNKGSRFEHVKAFEPVAQSAGGAASTTGWYDGERNVPTQSGAALGDSNSGMHLLIAILSALLQREHTGEGCYVYQSMQNAVLNLCRVKLRDQLILDRLGKLSYYDCYPNYEWGKQGKAIPRAANAEGGLVLGWCYRAKGWEHDPNAYVYIVVQQSKKGFENFCHAMGFEDWLTDPRFNTANARDEHKTEVYQRVEAYTMQFDKYTLTKELGAKGVPVGQYSEEILTKLGLLDGIRAKAVYGSDVRQVLAWVASGEADAGLVYATDAAVEPSVRVVATAPAGTHKPIIYPAAVLKDTKHLDTAKDFLAFVSNDKNKERFAKYGFEVK